MSEEVQLDPGPQFEYYPELGHEISREIPIYLDREQRLEAFVNIFRFKDGNEMVMFHIRMFGSMTARSYREFVKAIPDMEGQLSQIGRPIFTFFDVDSDVQMRFALKLGWELLEAIPMYDRHRRIYVYRKHLIRK